MQTILLNRFVFVFFIASILLLITGVLSFCIIITIILCAVNTIIQYIYDYTLYLYLLTTYRCIVFIYNRCIVSFIFYYEYVVRVSIYCILNLYIYIYSNFKKIK